MSNEAVGIAINGRDVKIAHVYRDKHRLGVDYLVSAVLTSDMEYELRKNAEEEATPDRMQNEEDLFSLRNTLESKSAPEKESSLRENVDVLYSLLRKLAARRIKVAFNVPPTRVSFQDLDSHLDYNKSKFTGTLQKKIEQWKQGFNAIDNVSVITRKDGTLCNVACEIKQPPILDLLEQLNTFFKNNLVLSLMDPNEVSLVNLARNSYKFHNESQITVIVDIEMEFSRIIFMKGDDLLTVSPIIPENFNPDIFSIVYSKIIYELDNLNIPEVNNILLAAKASSNAAKTFFEKKFPDAKVGFILSQPLAKILSSQVSREDLSNYAIPIALAWKVVDSKCDTFIQTNLLPTQIIERQKVLTLSFSGYLILILLGISAFVLTWKIAAKKIELSRLKSQNYSLEEQIKNSEKTVKRVNEIKGEISTLKKRIILSDSLSYGSDRLLSFLDRLNESVSRINSVWIEEVQSTSTGILIRGMSLKRGDVPRISESLNNAKIRKLTRSNDGSQRCYRFEMEVDWKQQPFQPGINRPLVPVNSPPITAQKLNTAVNKTMAAEWGSKATATPTVFSDKNVSKNNNENNFIPNRPAEDGLNFDKKEVKKVDKASYREAETELEPLRKAVPGSRTMVEIDRDRVIQPAASPLSLNSQEKSIPNESINDKLIRKADHRVLLTPDNTNEQVPLSNDGSSSHYTIRINAHVTRLTANKEIELYKSKGFECYITTLPNSSSDIPYWVCLGHFSSYQEAEIKMGKLMEVLPGSYDIVAVNE